MVFIGVVGDRVFILYMNHLRDLLYGESGVSYGGGGSLHPVLLGLIGSCFYTVPVVGRHVVMKLAHVGGLGVELDVFAVGHHVPMSSGSGRARGRGLV